MSCVEKSSPKSDIDLLRAVFADKRQDVFDAVDAQTPNVNELELVDLTSVAERDGQVS